MIHIFSVPNPATLDECDDLLETYHLLLQGKSKEKVRVYLLNLIRYANGAKRIAHLWRLKL